MEEGIWNSLGICLLGEGTRFGLVSQQELQMPENLVDAWKSCSGQGIQDLQPEMILKDLGKVECLPAMSNAQIVSCAQSEKVAWVVVGPEIPLAAGLAGI